MGATPAAGATVTWANADATADALTLTGSSVADVQFPSGLVGNARSIGVAQFGFGLGAGFSIVGTSGPVTVHFSAMVPYEQSLSTDSHSSATSDVSFELWIPQFPFSVVLDGQSTHSVGVNSFFVTGDTLNLENSWTLIAGEDYTLNAFLSSFARVETVAPEPPSLTCLLVGLLPVIGVIRRRYLNR